MNLCQCGCGEELPPRAKQGPPRLYLNNQHRDRHRSRNRAPKAKVDLSLKLTPAQLKERYPILTIDLTTKGVADLLDMDKLIESMERLPPLVGASREFGGVTNYGLRWKTDYARGVRPPSGAVRPR